MLLLLLLLLFCSDAAVGAGPSCSGSQQLTDSDNGTSVGALLNRTSIDLDGTLPGAAIVQSPTHPNGKWQYWSYHRNSKSGISLLSSSKQNQTSLPNALTERQSLLDAALDAEISRHDVWYSFPPSLSITSAFLLHPLDRIRFVPNPEFYWPTGGSNEPQILLRAWDIRMGGQSGETYFNLSVNKK